MEYEFKPRQGHFIIPELGFVLLMFTNYKSQETLKVECYKNEDGLRVLQGAS